MSLLVVFGAGASYDCAELPGPLRSGMTPFFRPPLAKELFDGRPPFSEYLLKARRAAGLIAELAPRVAGGADLELELDAVQVRAASDAVAASELMDLRFYLRDIVQHCTDNWYTAVSGITNYHWLIRRLDEWARDRSERVTYVTFNYDTLLDRAAQDLLRQGINSLDDYVAHPRAHIYKPHGSVNWVREVNVTDWDGEDRDWVINHAYSLEQLGEIQIQITEVPGLFVPALSVPIRSKNEFNIPSSHLNSLSEDLSHVDRVLVIGWRAMEQHFTELAHEVIPFPVERSMLCCKSHDDALGVTERFFGGAENRGVGVGGGGDHGFTDLLRSNELRDLLE